MSDKHSRGEHTISNEEFPAWAAERIALHEMLLARLWGRQKAAEYALMTVIGFHPDPVKLQTRWQELMPDLIDAEMEETLYDAEPFREGFQDVLRFVSKTLEAALRREQHDG